MIKVNDKELVKMIKVFGADKVISAYTTLKLNLKQEQLQYCIDVKNEKKEVK